VGWKLEPVLNEVAEGVWVRQSTWGRSNAIAIRGEDGILLVDPGIAGTDLEELADDLDRLRLRVVAGFSTHPHWDHLLWHDRFGQVPRYATARAAAATKESLERSRRLAAAQAPDAALELLGLVEALPQDAAQIPWQGPEALLVVHEAHAPGHAAVAIPDRGVLLAADMLSDIEIPLLDPRLPDQVTAYLTALDRLAGALTSEISTLVPGHGAVARGGEIGARVRMDRAYMEALHRGEEPADARLDPDATYDPAWLREMHEQNLRLAGVTP
jgi:glyoxylase-like metal-dependent hydrolase (beta-lactamase superfamily II)